MDPTTNTLKVANVNEFTESTIEYYITCSGSNPLKEPLVNAELILTALESGIERLTKPNGWCSGNDDLEDVLVYIREGNNTIYEVMGHLDCTSIQMTWNSLTQDSVCGDIVEGLYGVWITWWVDFMLLLIILTMVLNVPKITMIESLASTTPINAPQGAVIPLVVIESDKVIL